VILYQLFTGRLPFEGTSHEIMGAHLHLVPRSLREIVPQISPSLDHLILKLLSKSPSNRYASAQQARRISSSLVVSAGETPQHNEILIERDKELRELRATWETARTGKGQLAFISGESGIGKTTLAQQVAVQGETPVLLIGRCQNMMGGTAYQPFTEILRTYFATVPPEFFDKEVRQLLANFAPIIPEIREMLPDLPEALPLDQKQEQLRLMASVTQFIKRATKERPWLLILDDLQWADPGTLELLRHLGHHLPSMAQMIIGTYRSTEVRRGHPLLETLRDLSSHPTYRHHALNRLSKDGVGQFLTTLWQQAVPDPLIEKIYQRTQGNPFYVEEVANGLVSDNIITWQDGTWHFPVVEEVRLPENIREAVSQHIQHLSPDTQALLRQAAVLGQTFEFDELREVSGLSEWETLEHLDVALERQLIHEMPGETSLQFTHTEIRHVLYADMGTLRRRMLHRQAAEGLERLALPEPEAIASRLAYHYSEAGEFESALVYTIQAARQAESTFANDTALLWYNRTLEMIQQLRQKEIVHFQPLVISVHTYLGHLLTLMGRYEEALTHYTTTFKLIEEDVISPNISQNLAQLSHQIAEVYEKWGNYTAAFEWVEKGLAYLDEEISTTEAARLYLVGASVFEHQGQRDEAIAWCKKSLAIASEIKSEEGQLTRAKTYSRLGAICLLRGYFNLVVHFCSESIKIYQEMEDVTGQVRPYNNLGLAYRHQGDWDQAQVAFAKSIEIARDVGDINGQGIAQDNQATLHVYRGEWQKALALYTANQITWSQIGSTKNEAITLNNIAQVYILQKDWSEVNNTLKRSKKLFTETGSQEHLPELERRYGEFYLNTNKLKQALTRIKRSISLASEQDNPFEEAQSRRLLGEIHRLAGKHEAARAALDHSLHIFNELNSAYEAAKTQIALSRLPIEVGSNEEASVYLREAKETFEAIGAKIDLTEVSTLQAYVTHN
ncbi:MAG: tetratricopeptide repeat protein, partial [Chloroflexota bacterium]